MAATLIDTGQLNTFKLVYREIAVGPTPCIYWGNTCNIVVHLIYMI